MICEEAASCRLHKLVSTFPRISTRRSSERDTDKIAFVHETVEDYFSMCRQGDAASMGCLPGRKTAEVKSDNGSYGECHIDQVPLFSRFLVASSERDMWCERRRLKHGKIEMRCGNSKQPSHSHHRCVWRWFGECPESLDCPREMLLTKVYGKCTSGKNM